MTKNISATCAKLGLSVALFALTAVSHAAEHKRVSPHETVKASVDGNQMTIVYGRPNIKNPKTGEKRKIWGGLVPLDTVWRTGADEATILTTQQPIVIGGTTVPAGSYSVYTWPAKDGSAKLIINKQTGQWGTNYDAAQDVTRVDLVKKHLDSTVDEFTMAIDKASGGGVIVMKWEDTEYSARFTVAKSQ